MEDEEDRGRENALRIKMKRSGRDGRKKELSSERKEFFVWKMKREREEGGERNVGNEKRWQWRKVEKKVKNRGMDWGKEKWLCERRLKKQR